LKQIISQILEKKSLVRTNVQLSKTAYKDYCVLVVRTSGERLLYAYKQWVCQKISLLQYPTVYHDVLNLYKNSAWCLLSSVVIEWLSTISMPKGGHLGDHPSDLVAGQ
jgi:hypothetical protein